MKNQSVPLIPNKIIFALLLFATLCFGSLAHAQADRGGSGGDWSEADLKHFLTRLAPYLKSGDGQQVFPEVVEYDRAHPDETVEKVAGDLNPRLVNKPVFDSAGNERDCVSYTTPVRYFECNLNSLPRKPSENASESQKSEYYGSMYRLVLHEVFVQVGIEKPLTKEVPSEYEFSSRLMVHLESFPEWVPGASKFGESNKTDITIHNKPEWSLGLGAGGLAQNFGIGGSLKLQFPVTIAHSEFKFGIDTGFQYAFSNPRTWLLSLIPTVEYQFHPILGVKPYVRVGLGVSWFHSSGVYTEEPFPESGITGGSYPYSDTTANGIFEVTPGFSFGEHDQYFFEIPITRFGASTAWSIMPTIGFRF